MISRFHIDNMKCMGCVSTVQKALKGLTGCENATVDLESGTAQVCGSVDSGQLVNMLTELGYPTRALE